MDHRDLTVLLRTDGIDKTGEMVGDDQNTGLLAGSNTLVQPTPNSAVRHSEPGWRQRQQSSENGSVSNGRLKNCQLISAENGSASNGWLQTKNASASTYPSENPVALKEHMVRKEMEQGTNNECMEHQDGSSVGDGMDVAPAGDAPLSAEKVLYTDSNNREYTRKCLDNLVMERDHYYNEAIGYKTLNKRVNEEKVKSEQVKKEMEAKLENLRAVVRGDQKKLNNEAAKQLKSYIHDVEFRCVKYVLKEQMAKKDDIIDRCFDHLKMDGEVELHIYQDHVRGIIMQGLNEARQHSTRRLQTAVKGKW